MVLNVKLDKRPKTPRKRLILAAKFNFLLGPPSFPWCSVQCPGSGVNVSHSLSVLFLSPQMAPDSPDLTPSPWLRSVVIQNLSPPHPLSLLPPERENCFNVTL